MDFSHAAFSVRNSAVCQKLPDSGSNHHRFLLLCIKLPARRRLFKSPGRSTFCRILCGIFLRIISVCPDHYQFRCVRRRVFRFRKSRARLKSCIRIILHAAEITSHDLFKYRVDTVQHTSAASEVTMQVNSAVLRRIRPLITIQLLHKDFRSGKPEPVNALLHISYHEAVGLRLFILRNCFKNQLLDHIAVLVLIDQDLCKKVSVFKRRLRRHSFFRGLPRFMLHQDIQREMFHIGKINDILICLAFIKCCFKIQCQCTYFMHRPGTELHMPEHGIHIFCKKMLLQPCHCLFHASADVFYHFTFSRRNRIIFFRRKTSVGNCPKALLHLCKILFRRKARQHSCFLFQKFCIHVGSVRLFADPDGTFKLPRAFHEGFCTLLKALLYPGCLIEILCGKIIIFHPLLQPVLRPRHTHGKAV